MLIKFSVENFLSIKDRVEVDLTASAIKEYEEDNVVYTNNVKLLKCVSIYGANSSGKSNILKALVFVRKFILNTSNDQSRDFIDIDSFKFSTQTDNRPSKFELSFLLDGGKYRYQFEVDDERVHREELFFSKINKEYCYFSRIGQENTVSERFAEGLGLEERARPNTLFLTVVSQFNGKIAGAIIEWIKGVKYILDTERTIHQRHSSKLFEKPAYQKIMKRFMDRADLGFTDIESKEMIMPDWQEIDPALKEFLISEYKNENILVTSHPKFDDGGNQISSVFLNMFRDESLGTQKLFSMSGYILEALVHGRVLIIDEFDARLHPMLCTSIIELFNSKINNVHGAQLIFVTHNTNFLSKNILRRDQILITSKDKFGCTSIESLADKKRRSDEAFEKNYLLEEYGGVPKIRDGFRLFDIE